MIYHSFPEWYEERRPKAAKQHKCCECGGTIETGEVYVAAAGRWDGEFESFETCVDCESLRHDMVDSLGPDHDIDDRPGFGELGEWCVNSFYGDPVFIGRMIEVCRKRGSPRLTYLTQLVVGEFDAD